MAVEDVFCGLLASVVRKVCALVDLQPTSGIGVDFCATFEVLLGLWRLGLLGLLGLLLWSRNDGLRWACLEGGHEKRK